MDIGFARAGVLCCEGVLGVTISVSSSMDKKGARQLVKLDVRLPWLSITAFPKSKPEPPSSPEADKYLRLSLTRQYGLDAGEKVTSKLKEGELQCQRVAAS